MAETLTGTPRESTPPAENDRFTRGSDALRARLLLVGTRGIEVLNPNNINLAPVTHDEIQDPKTRDVYRIAAAASLGERTVPRTEYSERMNTWLDNTIKSFEDGRDFFSKTPRGRSMARVLDRIGLNPQTFTRAAAMKFYNDYLTDDSNGDKMESLADRIVNTDYTDGDLETVIWVKGVFGQQSGDIFAQLVDLKSTAKQESGRNSIVAGANKTINVRSVEGITEQVLSINYIPARDAQLASFLYTANRGSTEGESRTRLKVDITDQDRLDELRKANQHLDHLRANYFRLNKIPWPGDEPEMSMEEIHRIEREEIENGFYNTPEEKMNEWRINTLGLLPEEIATLAYKNIIYDLDVARELRQNLESQYIDRSVKPGLKELAKAHESMLNLFIEERLRARMDSVNDETVISGVADKIISNASQHLETLSQDLRPTALDRYINHYSSAIARYNLRIDSEDTNSEELRANIRIAERLLTYLNLRAFPLRPPEPSPITPESPYERVIRPIQATVDRIKAAGLGARLVAEINFDQGELQNLEQALVEAQNILQVIPQVQEVQRLIDENRKDAAFGVALAFGNAIVEDSNIEDVQLVQTKAGPSIRVSSSIFRIWRGYAGSRFCLQTLAEYQNNPRDKTNPVYGRLGTMSLGNQLQGTIVALNELKPPAA